MRRRSGGARTLDAREVCRRLATEDPRCVEIESKMRVRPGDAAAIRRYLLSRRGVSTTRASFFFDQFLDTPEMDLLRRGASLRVRYKKAGSRVYLQYKGPGFRAGGLLFRSEYSTARLRHVLREESRHDVVHFADTTVPELLARHAEPAMGRAMRRHLGRGVLLRITTGPVVCVYQKEKFLVDVGGAFLEPSLDRVFAFRIHPAGLHALSTFCEYENEIKTPGGGLPAKLRRLDRLRTFDAGLAERFALDPEPLDKYRRCASFAAGRGSARRRRA